MRKSAVCILLSACLASTVLPVEAAASLTKPYNWYCRHVHDGTQPTCDAEMQFIQQYDGYYIDAKHSDPAAAEKVIYLTFDAGYENGNVARILDAMKAEGVTGAFFILENVAKRNPDLVRRMADEGHLVCNHTASHRDMTKCHNADGFAAELAKMEQVCLEQCGVQVAKYYRPPEGRFSEENMQFASALGYKTIFWSFGYVDWDNDRQMSPADALEKILDCVHNGEVLLLHPTSATNAEIMPALIRELRARGFRFGTLDELTAKQE